MSESKKYKYLEVPEPDDVPEFPTKKGRSLSSRIVDEFLESGLERAIINIPEKKTGRGMLIGISKIMKNRKLEYESRLDAQGRLWILKKVKYSKSTIV